MTETKPRSALKERVLLAVVVAVVLGAVMAGAYYKEDITNYVSLHGWEAGSAEKLVRDFVRAAHDGDPAAPNMLDGAHAKPVTKGGKMVAIHHPVNMGPSEVPIPKLIPTGDVKSTSSRIRPISKVFGVAVEYADGHWAEFAVGRTPAGLKIVDISDGYGNQRLAERP